MWAGLFSTHLSSRSKPAYLAGWLSNSCVCWKKRNKRPLKLPHRVRPSNARDQDRADGERKSKQDRDAVRSELAESFEGRISRIVEAVALAAADMQSLTSSISVTNADTVREATAAATASTQASTNVETIASSTGHLSASINDISKQVSRSTEIAAKAAEEARRTNTVVEGLATGTHKIGEVITLIQSIASQDQPSWRSTQRLRQRAQANMAGDLLSWPARSKRLPIKRRRQPKRYLRKSRTFRPRPAKPLTLSRRSAERLPKSTRYRTIYATAVDRQGLATREIAGNLQQASDGTKQVNPQYSKRNRGFVRGRQVSDAPAGCCNQAVFSGRRAEVRAR